MKIRNVLFTSIILVSAVGLGASSAIIQGCTKDGYKANLSVEFSDEATAKNNKIVPNVVTAFRTTARKFTGNELMGQDAYDYFVSLLSQEEFNAITDIYGPPAVNTQAACDPGVGNDHNRQAD